jgi:hypothetical protein
MADQKTFKRKLTVTAQTELATFKNKKDEDTTIFEIKAVTETGEVVKEKLRTFQVELPQGELVEYDVSIYDDEKYGRSYTIKMPSQGRASKKDVSELRKELTTLADRVGQLEEQVHALKPKSQGEQARDEKYGGDDDIPF